MIVTSQKKRNSYFKLLATLPNNAKAGKRVSVTVSSHQIRPERKLEKRNISQTSTAQRYNLVNSTEKDSLFEILQMRIGKQYAYMLGAYDARIVFACFNKQFKGVESSHFSTIDYFI